MRYILDTTPTIHLPKDATHPFIKELITNYTFGKQWNVLLDAKQNTITIGDFEKADLKDDEHIVHITDSGVYIAGTNYTTTMHGLITFLDKLVCDGEDSFYIDACCVRQKPLLAFRAVHLCIFPETKLDFFRKCVRSCAISKYTHIVFEFWGMLKYDCMQELAWPFAFSKAQIKEIVAEANALGVEIIPMFNHLGHASACREIHGKHVVLDQNPTLSYMFNSYGWIWNFKREDVYALLKKIREELIDVCGDGKWFHLGCDEAYAIGKSEQSALEMAEKTGCDGIMIGREALGNPWIFDEIKAYFKSEEYSEKTKEERIFAAVSLVSSIVEMKGEERGIREARGRAAHFIRGLRGSAEKRAALNSAKSFSEFVSILNEWE